MGFRIPHFQHFPPFASIIFLSFLIFQHPPCPPPGALPSGRAGNAGNKPPVGRMVCPSFPVPHGFSPWAPAWQELYVPQTVKCRGAGGGIPRRHLLSLPRGFEVGLPPPALARPAPGERTISNAEVPLPRSPLSLATGTANRKAVLSVLRRTGDAEGKPPPGTCMAGAVRAANGLIPGCRGRSPRQNKLIVSPFPPGRGSGG